MGLLALLLFIADVSSWGLDLSSFGAAKKNILNHDNWMVTEAPWKESPSRFLKATFVASSLFVFGVMSPPADAQPVVAPESLSRQISFGPSFAGFLLSESGDIEMAAPDEVEHTVVEEVSSNPLSEDAVGIATSSDEVAQEVLETVSAMESLKVVEADFAKAREAEATSETTPKKILVEVDKGNWGRESEEVDPASMGENGESEDGLSPIEPGPAEPLVAELGNKDLEEAPISPEISENVEDIVQIASAGDDTNKRTEKEASPSQHELLAADSAKDEGLAEVPEPLVAQAIDKIEDVASEVEVTIPNKSIDFEFVTQDERDLEEEEVREHQLSPDQIAWLRKH